MHTDRFLLSVSAARGGAPEVLLWDVAEGQCVRRVRVGGSYCGGAAWSRDGARVGLVMNRVLTVLDASRDFDVTHEVAHVLFGITETDIRAE